MFTIKLYRDNLEGRLRILDAEDFTILRGEGTAEITLHRTPGANGENRDVRYDINHNPETEGWPERFDKAIIENAMGKTTEIIVAAFPTLSEVKRSA